MRVSETNNNGQRVVRVEATGGQRAGSRRLPRTAGEYPLLGMLGLIASAAGAGVRFSAPPFRL